MNIPLPDGTTTSTHFRTRTHSSASGELVQSDTSAACGMLVETPVDGDAFPVHFGDTLTSQRALGSSERPRAASSSLFRRSVSSASTLESTSRKSPSPSSTSGNWFSDSFRFDSSNEAPHGVTSSSSSSSSSAHVEHAAHVPASSSSPSKVAQDTSSPVFPARLASLPHAQQSIPHPPQKHQHSHAPTPPRVLSAAPSVEDPDHSEDRGFSNATSTVLQATINSSNVMLGMGILTLPYAFHITGWICGISMLSLFALAAQFTAKLLGKCMNVPFPLIDPTETTPLLNPHRHRTVPQNSPTARLATSLSDIVELAFGPSARPFVSSLFMLELFAAATGLIILGADSIASLNPHWPLLSIKIVVTCVLVLTTMPRGMGWLAFGSLVGLLTLLSLFFILLFNGVTTQTTPGSLWSPSPTNLWPEETSAFGEVKSMWLAAGLFCLGLDAHAVFPSIVRDLKVPQQFGSVVERAYVVNWGLYLAFGSVGYLMFGKDVLPQVTQNFPLIPTFNTNLTSLILVLTALNPFTKYALIMAPVHFQLEEILQIPNLTLPASHTFVHPYGILIRLFVGLLAILTTIQFPAFHVLIGLVGSLFSFMVVGVIPALCYLRLGTGSGWRQEGVVEGCRITWREAVACVVIVVGAVCFGALGTVASFCSE
ncbi:hypothetical protein HDU98_005394 [Podochytrium sp. JEL0797]|nr:hypothetical protein HDU98_005394 [Podochytrium sp. JEL0797]